MQKPIKNTRLSNFELLRIVTIFMIIMHHFCIHGIILNGWEIGISTLNHINNFILLFFYFGGQIGINIFLLLTGFFLINHKSKVL